MKETVNVAVPRALHGQLHKVQVAMAAEAGKPLSLGAVVQQLVDTWRRVTTQPGRRQA